MIIMDPPCPAAETSAQRSDGSDAVPEDRDFRAVAERSVDRKVCGADHEIAVDEGIVHTEFPDPVRERSIL